MQTRRRDILKMGLAASLLGAIPGCGDKNGKKIFRIAYVSGPSELLHTAAQEMARRIETESNGEISVRLYPSGQLGGDRVLLESVMLGGIDMVISGLAVIGWYAREYSMVEAPFLWRDFDHIDLVWADTIGKEIRNTVNERTGLALHNPWYRGPRYLTTTDKKIKSPDDLVGLKLRVPDLKVYRVFWEASGANVTPLDFKEIFMALKLGLVEGQENPLATIYGNNLHEVQKYIMETKHLIGFYLPVTGPTFKKNFMHDEQAIILSAIGHATDYHNDEVARSESDYREKIQAAGVEFVAIDNEPFRQIARREIPSRFADTWKPGLYQAISEAK